MLAVLCTDERQARSLMLIDGERAIAPNSASGAEVRACFHAASVVDRRAERVIAFAGWHGYGPGAAAASANRHHARVRAVARSVEGRCYLGSLCPLGKNTTCAARSGA